MVGEDLESTALAAFSTDREGRVVEWNEAAQRLLGYERKQVLGKPCHEIVQGTDLSGNRYCSEWCVPRDMAAREECIHCYPMEARTRSGETVRVTCCILVVRNSGSLPHSLIHFLHVLPPVPDGYREGEPAAAGKTNQAEDPIAAPSGEPPKLSPRELEVLRLLSAGATTHAIAAALFISPATVRTHVQAILHKLGAHTKLEAVSIALQHRLVQIP
jgi:PAS domain S-box-containing protein